MEETMWYVFSRPSLESRGEMLLYPFDPAIVWMFVSYAEILALKVMISGGGPFGGD